MNHGLRFTSSPPGPLIQLCGSETVRSGGLSPSRKPVPSDQFYRVVDCRAADAPVSGRTGVAAWERPGSTSRRAEWNSSRVRGGAWRLLRSHRRIPTFRRCGIPSYPGVVVTFDLAISGYRVRRTTLRWTAVDAETLNPFPKNGWSTSQVGRMSCSSPRLRKTRSTRRYGLPNKKKLVRMRFG